MSALTLLAIAVLLGILLWIVMGRDAGPYLTTARYSHLLRRTLGNRDTAERLIAHEKERYPTASREALIRHTIERWKQHNR